jgi:hypothetical protein
MEIASSLNNRHRIVTLTEILPLIRQLQIPDKLRLIRILAEQLDTDGNFFPLESDKTYNMPTPYNTFGAAEILMNTLRAENTETL